MKIIYKQGDLTTCPETFIAHGCNCQGKMGKGIALDIRTAFPKAYYDYVLALQTKGLYPGDIIVSDVGTLIEEKIIFNCLTQFTYNSNPDIKNVSYDYIRSCMVKLNLYMINNGHENEAVAMSKIGSSLGGGDWKIISEIIEDESTHFQPIVYTKED